MPYDFTYKWNRKNKINKIETDSQHGEQMDGFHKGGEVGDWVKKVKGLRSTNC